MNQDLTSLVGWGRQETMRKHVSIILLAGVVGLIAGCRSVPKPAYTESPEVVLQLYRRAEVVVLADFKETDGRLKAQCRGFWKGTAPEVADGSELDLGLAAPNPRGVDKSRGLLFMERDPRGKLRPLATRYLERERLRSLPEYSLSKLRNYLENAVSVTK
jgi:hypothetical protein